MHITNVILYGLYMMLYLLRMRRSHHFIIQSHSETDNYHPDEYTFNSFKRHISIKYKLALHKSKK
jgi:hypothetical protein